MKKLSFYCCDLTHVPRRLHWNWRKKDDKFYEGELLFRRCPNRSINNPYNSISLYDLSLNRQGSPKQPISEASDVLIDCHNNGVPTHYTDYSVITMRIQNLIPNNTFVRYFSKSNAGEEFNVEMLLKHDPIPCMYPHSVFQFTFNGRIVTKNNYSETLGRDNKTMSKLRQECRGELADILIKGEVVPGIIVK